MLRNRSIMPTDKSLFVLTNKRSFSFSPSFSHTHTHTHLLKDAHPGTQGNAGHSLSDCVPKMKSGLINTPAAYKNRYDASIYTHAPSASALHLPHSRGAINIRKLCCSFYCASSSSSSSRRVSLTLTDTWRKEGGWREGESEGERVACI